MSITRLGSPSRISGSSIVAARGLYGLPPRTIAGLQLWLDASDTSTLFDATSGGALVTNGNTVARWEDKSGFGRHFTQGTANNRPTLRTNNQNGFATIEFDGTNDRLVGDGTPYVKSTAGFTIYIVYKLDTTAGSFPVLFSTRTDTAENWRIIEADSAQTGYRTFGFGSANSSFVTGRTNSTTRGNWYAATISVSTGLNSITNYTSTINNSSVTLSASSTFGSDTGAGASLGAYVGGSFPLKGNIAELIIYDTQLSSGDNTVIMNYLKRWALY